MACSTVERGSGPLILIPTLICAKFAGLFRRRRRQICEKEFSAETSWTVRGNNDSRSSALRWRLLQRENIYSLRLVSKSYSKLQF